MVGKAWSYGKDNYGNLGLGEIISIDLGTVFTPHQMIGLPDKPVTKIASYNLHTCLLNEEGKVWCVGYNRYGQLGFTTSAYAVYTPGLVSFSNTIVDIGVGYSHSCALNDQGQLWCFGRNDVGQLGLGHNDNKSSPTHVSTLGTEVEAFSVGHSHTCALKLDKSFWCWGRNNFGQLGDGSTSNKNLPTQVSLQAEVLKFANGYFHTCILDVAKNVFCWGHNQYGQLGVGDTNNRNIPTQVIFPAGSSTPTDIVTGHYHTCAPTASGELYCWGRNDYGQLGTNSTTDEDTPKLSLWKPQPTPPTPTPSPEPAPTDSSSCSALENEISKVQDDLQELEGIVQDVNATFIENKNVMVAIQETLQKLVDA